MLTIVVIDEDAAMRSLLTEWLEAEGYAVRALAAPGRLDDAQRCDLVVFSVARLRNTGPEVARELRTSYPSAALIAMSTQLSASGSAAPALARSLGVNQLLAKPIAREEFLGAVVACIGAVA
jgi:CheY-like chemotaxis protein